MIDIAHIQKIYALVIGAVLGLVGIIGFFNAPILGLFGVNTAQNALHIAGGALGIWLAFKGSGMSYNKWLGAIAVALTLLGFIPYAKDLLLSIFNINMAITYLHAAIGIVSLGVAFGIKEGAA
ncbi:DUF4383 domain-containing protein [Candidatus Woesearchaeota archaeon]|nr:DUF4383 domain-containing protein [Candidatus Woesearchaeota archaeon]MBI2130704.1 DUF4383 domain-containing protein [Candidatus Woesearchaeota archaeon]MBI2660782.1 DUF4383 domain-containing protein [Candidatus Woesearchaeota archaeon]